MSQRSTVVGVVLLLVGLGLLGHGYVAQQAAAGDQPVTVDGTVQNATAVPVAGGEGENATYRAVIQYTFTHEGESYESTNVYKNDDEEYESLADAAQLSAQYEAGDTVTVSLPDGDPSRAYLKGPSQPPWYLGELALGGLLALVGLVRVVQGRVLDS